MFSKDQFLKVFFFSKSAHLCGCFYEIPDFRRFMQILQVILGGFYVLIGLLICLMYFFSCYKIFLAEGRMLMLISCKMSWLS